MAKLLRMPAVAANATEAVLQGWAVSENAAFKAADTIATVETDKAVVDVESESAGILLKTLVHEGAHVEVGTPIALLGDPGEIVDDLDGLLAELGVQIPGPTPAPPAPEQLSTEPGARQDSETARRDLPDVPMKKAPILGASRLPGTDKSAQKSSSGGVPSDGAAPGARPPGSTRIFSSPLARRLAKQAGIPIEEISGTGPHGRIVRRDVEAAVVRAERAEPTTLPAPRPVPSARTEPTAPEPFTEVPHTRLRRSIAARLTESKQAIPHFYIRGVARVDRLLELRAQLNEVSPVRISVNDLVIKAVARAHTLVPAMNVIWTPDAARFFSSVDIAVAIATERGLVAPVLRSVERTGVSSVAAAVKDFVERARIGTIQQHELEGGSLSVTNLGMFGTEEFAAIINPPHAAVLAVGGLRQEPVAEDGNVSVASVMRVTLSVDHRPVDGVVAAEWMKEFLSILEDPLQIIL
jgi:pyruvate dehydrogenase E2 component (dihydrolipoamide acetyltransferase)